MRDCFIIQATRGLILKLISILFFFLLSLSAIAQPAWLDIKKQSLELPNEVMQVWQENVFSSDKELWVVDNSLKFHLYLNQIGLSLKLNSIIAKQMQRQSSGIETGYLFSFYEVPSQSSLRAYYFLDLNLLENLELQQIQKIYQYMANTIGLPLAINFKSENDLSQWLENLDLSSEGKNKLKGLVVQSINQKLLLPVTRFNWDLIPDSKKYELIQEQILKSHNNLEVFLNINTQNDIREIAKRFSGSLSFKEIEEYLLIKWQVNSKLPLRINLLEILPQFMQFSYAKFSKQGGPNCFNCAMNSSRQSAFNVEYSSKEELKKHLSRYYRPMGEFEMPQVGDLIIYANSKKNPIHAANYLPFDLTFTKNGINKFSSYQIQDLGAVDALYSSFAKTNVKYYRLKNPASLHLNTQGKQNHCSSSAFID